MIPRKPILGLVGAIGAGKSTVAKRLAARGGAVVDADTLGHDALDQPEIRERIVAEWGNVLRPDGRVDRRKVAAIVFASQEERRKLEHLTFPFIRRRCEDAIQAAMNNVQFKFVVLDAAVMLEAGWVGVCDRLLYVDAPRELRLKRVAERSGWTAADLDAREAAQMPAEEKRRYADAVIMNDGTIDELDRDLTVVLRRWNLTV
ncbi:MAG: dephospho-CoA kinase [Planctomycetia bacterium]|nr:dephospho-CoA kinase [Planctomycetia bacterium]